MKTNNTLRRDQETAYHYFIRNVTQLIKNQFGISIERVSPVNEPENIFAPWEHTDMSPDQLCSMVNTFNDSLISICPENSYFWVSEIYSESGKGTGRPTCADACQIFGTHGYTLNVDFTSTNNFKAYYDLTAYERKTTQQKPIWQTEVSSTFDNYETEEMQEAIDLAFNIANFLGVTCIQRYYFWYSYTLGASGESLTWGQYNGSLKLPKKYYAYKHNTLASQATPGPMKVTSCGPETSSKVKCIKYGEHRAVFSNNVDSNVTVNWKGAVQCISGSLCCTTNDADWGCDGNVVNATSILPSKSVCSCEIKEASLPGDSSTAKYFNVSIILLPITLIIAIILR
jgi:hypothetical protein